MFRNITFFIIVILGLFLTTCRMDFSTELSQGELEFSKDTVFLDTVFSNIGSSTYRLKVYNRSKKAITIPTIKLGRGSNSGYRLNVDGLSGIFFENIDILPQDSIFVFIETTINYNEVTDPLYVDDLVFDSGANEQVVKLVTLVQDAHFLYPNKINGFPETLVIPEFGNDSIVQARYLSDSELSFSNEKPYVIYGYMVVGDVQNSPKTLTIQSGAKVHFHAGSGLIVNKNSTLKIMGTQNIEGHSDTEVLIQGDRLEPQYENKPGQWGLILLRNGSVNNYINYATIKNGSIGLIAVNYLDINIPVLEINNSQFYNHSVFGLYGIHTHIKGTNLVFNNFGLSAFAGVQGGVYDFTHCTFANYWKGGARNTPTVLLNNFYKDENEIYFPFNLNKANFTNCIIYGSNNIEMKLEKVDAVNFNYLFTNNLIRFNDTGNNYSNNQLYNFSDTNHFIGNLFNQNPDFKNEFLTVNKMWVGVNTAGKGKALWTNGSALVPFDILGKPRVEPADLGAYNSVNFE